MKIRINVTQNDIKNGLRRDSDACAVHNAIDRRLNENTIVEVGSEVAYFYNNHIWPSTYSLVLPEKVTKFIRTYDNNKTKCKPFSFTLDIPDVLLSG